MPPVFFFCHIYSGHVFVTSTVGQVSRQDCQILQHCFKKYISRDFSVALPQHLYFHCSAAGTGQAPAVCTGRDPVSPHSETQQNTKQIPPVLQRRRQEMQWLVNHRQFCHLSILQFHCSDAV